MLVYTYMAYSHTKFQISKRDVLHLIKQSNTVGLTAEEESIIEDTILRVRTSNELISLFEIDEALKVLERKRIISNFDRSFVMHEIEKYAVQ